jgi:hypothetical protein
MHSDAFFILATDQIARKLNEIRQHQLWQATNRGSNAS